MCLLITLLIPLVLLQTPFLSYPPGSVVFVRLNSAGDVSEGIVNSVPTSLHDFYLIFLLEGGSLSAAFGDLISPDEALNPAFYHLPNDDSSGDPRIRLEMFSGISGDFLSLKNHVHSSGIVR